MGDDAIVGDAEAEAHAGRVAAIGLAADQGREDAGPVERREAGAGIADLDPEGARLEARVDLTVSRRIPRLAAPQSACPASTTWRGGGGRWPG